MMFYLNMSTFYFQQNQPALALSTAQSAVSLLGKGQYSNHETAMAYLVLGEADVLSNNGPEASANLEKSEKFERKAISNAFNEAQRKEYKARLASVLSFHAHVLAAAGDSKGAQMKTAEAAKL